MKSFAEATRQKEIDNKNPNFPNKDVGELHELMFAGHKAFLCVVLGSMDGYGNDSGSYIFLENDGVKFSIYYPFNDKLSESILNTFEFVD